MKKLISVFTMMFLCSFSYAESMKFITVLSSPVGTFNKLEAVDPVQPAKGNTVNFCTSIGTQGSVELKGTKTADLNIVSLARNTTLGKTDEGKFSLNNITLKQGGSIRGERLFGNTVTVNNAASGKANNLYGNQLTVAGAKTKTLDVNSGASKISTQHDAADMVWSNEYQSDTACGNTAVCAKQYLLKSKGSAASVCEKDQTRTTTERCDISGPDVTANNGCGVIQEYCNQGVWAVGGCTIAPTSECVTGQTKKDCRTTAGQTNCVDYVCRSCRWGKETTPSYYGWSTDGLEYSAAVPASNAIYSLNYGVTTNISVCVQYYASTFPGNKKESTAGKVCNASLDPNDVYIDSCRLECTGPSSSTNLNGWTCHIEWKGTRCIKK